MDELEFEKMENFKFFYPNGNVDVRLKYFNYWEIEKI
jgi:hypothetical protein